MFELKRVNSRVEFQGTPTPGMQTPGAIKSREDVSHQLMVRYLDEIVLSSSFSYSRQGTAGWSTSGLHPPWPGRSREAEMNRNGPFVQNWHPWWPEVGRRTLKGNPSAGFSDRSGHQEERRLKLLPLPPSQMYQVETGCILTRRPTAVWHCSRRPNSRVFHILFRRLSFRECRE